MKLSLRWVAWMARGADEVEWRRMREAVEWLRASWVPKPMLPEKAMNPYYVEPPPPTPEENRARMQDYLAGLDARFAPRG